MGYPTYARPPEREAKLVESNPTEEKNNVVADCRNREDLALIDDVDDENVHACE